MPKPDWKEEIASCFDDLRILEKCRTEVDAKFAHFYEFVARPAFEALAEQFKPHRIRCAFGRSRDNRFHFEATFPGRREPQFEYCLWVPPRAVELSFMLTLQGRPFPGGAIQEKTFPFLKSAAAADILRLDKDDLAHDVVARYKRFVTGAAITPEGPTEGT